MDWREINGCGIRLGWLGVIRPPHAVFFDTDCVLHDEMYNLGGTEADRKKADKRLFDDMVRHSIIHFKDKALSQWWFITLAYMYYLLVRSFGKKHFNYRK